MSTISWLMPVRDGLTWLLESVPSVLAEMGPNDEFVIVDDGSKNDITDYLPTDNRLKLIRLQPSGIVTALNAGLIHCTGDYIARIDSDDIVMKGRASLQKNYLDGNPHIAVLGGKAILFSDEDKPGKGMLRYVDWVNGLKHLSAAMFIESPLFHPAVMMRADVIKHVGGYREGDFPEDYELWLRICSHGFQIDNLKNPIVRIRDHGNRLTRTDKRYSKKAFTLCKQMYFGKMHLKDKQHVTVWGAGKNGKPWIRWLERENRNISLVDSFITGRKFGLPVHSPEKIPTLKCDLIIVAVGALGAKTLIRKELHEMMPHFIEGKQWIAVV